LRPSVGPAPLSKRLRPRRQQAIASEVCIYTNGSIVLEDGRQVHGFLCERHAVEGAEDITAFGGWRAYLQHARAAVR